MSSERAPALDVRVVRPGARAGTTALTEDPERPVFLYRVTSLAETTRELVERGLKADRTIELPMGPAMTFHAPGGLRLAIYEPSRPFVVESMTGQRDF